MTTIGLYSVTYRADPYDDEITVEIIADDQQAIERRNDLALDGIHAVIGCHEMTMG